jgi:hypothetical protein
LLISASLLKIFFTHWIASFIQLADVRASVIGTNYILRNIETCPFGRAAARASRRSAPPVAPASSAVWTRQRFVINIDTGKRQALQKRPTSDEIAD